MRVTTYFAFPLALLLLCLCSAKGYAAPAQQAASCNGFDTTYTDFYNPPDLGEAPLTRLGELLRVEHMQSFTAAQVATNAGIPVSTYGAEAYRVLFLSQGPAGVAQAVSGIIIVPTGTEPKSYPVLVNGHATVGVADSCALSRSTLSLPSLLAWVAQGFIVTSSDYVGLGTPGLHPYIVGDVAAYNMLDSARAALNFCDATRGVGVTATNQVILEGHSQGGQAALFAQAHWPTYAPELNVLGTVAFAPGSEFRFLANQMAQQQSSSRVAPFVLSMYSYSQYYGAPTGLAPWLNEPFASELAQQVEGKCVTGVAAWLGFQPEKVFQADFLQSLRNQDWAAVQPWTNYMDWNTPGDYKSAVPTLILQGDFDNVVLPEASLRLTKRLCAAGTGTQLKHYPGIGHSKIVDAGFADALAWINDRLANLPATEVCQTNELTARSPLGRDTEPVIVQGELVKPLAGTPINELRLFAYSVDEEWQQIPFQVDEVNALGVYSTKEDERLDSNDELIFMAKDLGQRASTASNIPISGLADSQSVELEATNPLSPTQRGWAYLVHAPADTPASTVDYVSFDPTTRRLNTTSYTVGFPLLHEGIDFLALGDGVNILDRTKYYQDCPINLLCPITENMLFPTAGLEVLKDGPIRVLLRQGQIVAYESMLSWQASYEIKANLAGPVRLSTDFNQEVKEAVFYNAAVTDGVVVDGQPDGVPATPFSPWWQLSNRTGTLIQVFDTAGITGELSNYYVDNETPDAADTGDQKHYGDAGLLITNPGSPISYRAVYHFLPDTQPNVGATYAAYQTQPIVIATQPFGQADEDAVTVYLPVARR